MSDEIQQWDVSDLTNPRLVSTVVPGVPRYHRSECILIRFLGEDDLELMSKQEAISTGLTACRACQPDQLPDS